MIRVYGSKVSYFTGKLETYLRYKGLEYEQLSLPEHAKKILKNVGTTQMPAVEIDGGRWLSDTTPIIHYFETQSGAASIFPDAAALRFLAQLVEDYADEWLWRPAMHYRWSYSHDRQLLSSILVDESTGPIPLPRFLKRLMIKTRRRRGFVIGDGVTDATRPHVELGYMAALENMQRLLASHRFLLGDIPSIADVGLMGPMLRHFGQDPTPANLMRNRAPAVYAWVGRMWNARASDDAPNWIDASADALQPMLQEICETHLVQYRLNADAFADNAPEFDAQIQGCGYRDLPVSRYRVWCLEELQREFTNLKPDDQQTVRSALAFPDAEVLWAQPVERASGYDESREAPFNKAINVYGKGVPKRRGRLF